MSISNMTFYRVTLTNPGGLVAPANGWVDNVRVETYLQTSVPGGFSFAQSQAKERGNMRFADVIGQLQMMANLYIENTVSTGADAATEPTAFAFTAEVERGDDVLVTRNDLGGVDLTGAAAIRRCVARALIMTYTRNALVYDPTATVAPGNATSFARNPGRTAALTVGALAANLTAAEALVTVAKIANVG